MSDTPAFAADPIAGPDLVRALREGADRLEELTTPLPPLRFDEELVGEMAMGPSQWLRMVVARKDSIRGGGYYYALTIWLFKFHDVRQEWLAPVSPIVLRNYRIGPFARLLLRGLERVENMTRRTSP